MGGRIFLGISAAIWLPYGLYCFFQPDFLADAAGVAPTSATGNAELRAMYGGLQAAIGALALAGAVRRAFTAQALVTLAVLTCGLGVARLLGAALDDAFTPYTFSGLAVEFGTLIFCVALLRGASSPPASLEGRA